MSDDTIGWISNIERQPKYNEVVLLYVFTPERWVFVFGYRLSTDSNGNHYRKVSPAVNNPAYNDTFKSDDTVLDGDVIKWMPLRYLKQIDGF